MKKQPVIFLVLKILTPIFLGLAIFGFVLIIKGFGDFESNNFMIGGFLLTASIFLTFASASIGFSPEIRKASVKMQKYHLEENKEDLKDVANVAAEINREAVTTTASAFKEGFTSSPEDQQMYCKHCGAQIDADSRFCKTCGKEQ